MQEIVTLACEKWAAGDKVGQWKYESVFSVHHTSCYLRIKYLMFQPPSARNNEKCANQIATNLAKKFGPGWNAVVGEAFSFEISYTKYVDIVDIICGIMKLSWSLLHSSLCPPDC